MERRAELAWKWLLRLGGLGLMCWVILGPMEGQAPLAVYVMLGGMIGLPSVWNVQERVNRAREDGRDLARGWRNLP